MSFHFEADRLYVEDVAMAEIARIHGTPTFVYSRALVESNYLAYRNGFGTRRHQICYAVKANGNIAILDVLARLGCSFDIVSGGELERVRAAGGKLESITFAGVGKTREEMAEALAAKIACFNIESVAELELLNQVAIDLGVVANIALRVNPDVDANTHPYISTGLSENKFGIPMDAAAAVYQRANKMAGISVKGVACHIGSQLTSVAPIVDAAKRVMHLVAQLSDANIEFEHIDIGGGLGIAYGTEAPPPISDYVTAICAQIPPRYEIIIEPGRSIVGDAGALLMAVLSVKRTAVKNFAICDAAMTELIRPALYQAYHPILAVAGGGTMEMVDVVGPVCESADFLARDRELAVSSGALLSVMDCGAYSAVMASNYNARPRAAEVLVDGSEVHLIRSRETVAQLYANENRLPESKAH